MLVSHLDNDADWLLALHGNSSTKWSGDSETTPLLPDSLLVGFIKPSESRIRETILMVVNPVETWNLMLLR